MLYMDGRYFKYKELVYSEKAIKLKIDNTPTEEIKAHLEELIPFLDGIREAWGSAVIVTSGYRCYELNKAVDGSKTSSHLYGWAVDLRPKNGYVNIFFDFVIKYFKQHGIPFDQIIDEYGKKSHWVHIGLKHKDGRQRKQILIYRNGIYHTYE